jgi:hypothetical protein
LSQALCRVRFAEAKMIKIFFLFQKKKSFSMSLFDTVVSRSTIILLLPARVARWFVFKPKIQIWENL